MYIGRPYTFTFKLSPIIYKDDKQIATVHNKLKLKNFEILFAETGFFKVEVTPDGRSLYSYKYTGKILGNVDVIIGDVIISSGKFRFPVMGDSIKSTITITNDTITPCSFQAAEWEGMISSGSKHV